MRQVFIFLAACFVLVGSIAATGLAYEIRDVQLRGYVDPTKTTDLPYRIPRLGVNADLLQYSENDLQQNLSLMQDANIHWVRQFVYWDVVEPEQGIFEWDTLDSLFNTLKSYPDIQPVIVIMNSPEWARTSDVLTAPPDNPQDIQSFLREFAKRYGDVVDYYQIWDEPNLDDTWGLANPNPVAYTALLSEAYQAIHSGDLEATVIAAALAPTTEREGQNIADVLYLEDLYQIGADAYFDAVAAKPYGFDSSPDDHTVNIDMLNFARIVALREIMLAYDDGTTALWASNWGWNALPDDWTGSPSIWGDVTQTEQSQYVLDGLDRAEREWAWLGGMILHHWQPNAPDDDPIWGFAIIDQNDKPTPLYNVLVNRPQPEFATNGLYHPRTPYAQYSGLWTFSDLGADIGWLETTDSRLAFDFVGSDIALLLREGDYFAFLYPTIDERQANATPRDSDGNAYILLRSDALAQNGGRATQLNTVAVARNLPNKVHQLEIAIDKGWDQWALAGYAVSSGDLAKPYTLLITGGWFAIVTTFVATVVSGYFLNWRSMSQWVSSMLEHLLPITDFAISLITSLALMISFLLTWGQPEPNIFRRDVVHSASAIAISGGLQLTAFLTLSSGGLYAVNLPVFVVFAAVLILFVLIYRNINLGLQLILLYAPFFLFPVELYLYAFPMAELLLLLTFGAAILRAIAYWGYLRQMSTSDIPIKLGIKLRTFDYLMLVWLVLGLLALIWAQRLDPALTEFRVLILEPVLFYALLRFTVTTREQIMRLVQIVIVSGVLVSVIGFVLFAFGQSVITAEAGARRLASVYGSPNNVGLWLGRCVPFALALTLGGINQQQRYVYGVATVIMLIAVVLTQSVGALLFGLPVGILVVIILTYGKRALPIVFGLIILGLVSVAGLTQVSSRFASLLDISTGTNFIRLRVWESSVEIIKQQPITGLGLDQFLYEYSAEHIRPDAIQDPDLSHPHNILLDFWIRLGVMGAIWLGIFVCVYVYWIRNHYSAYRSTMLIGAFGASVAMLAHGLIDNSIYVNDLALIFALLIALPHLLQKQSVLST